MAQMVQPLCRPRRTLAAPLLLGLLALVVGLLLALPGRALASTATYSATETIPVPPASNYTGSAGGDGWAVALSSDSVYNVFHHSGTLQVACHLQKDATLCNWPSDPATITDANGNNFASSAQPGLYLDQNTGKLYVFATRTSDNTGGVVCIDTTQAPTSSDPFCGFTALTPSRDASNSGISAISDPAQIGSRWYAFNYVSGAAAGASSSGSGTGAENTVLCFDLTSFSACGSQPFALPAGDVSGTVTEPTDFPGPAVAAIAGQLIVPISFNANNATSDYLTCFDPSKSGGSCSGSWPVLLPFSYDSNAGAPFPLLNGSGTTTGLCLPASYTDSSSNTVADPCYSLSGSPQTTPPGMATAIRPTSGWNGPGMVLGPRVYVPNFNYQTVDCYDYQASASCTGFPDQLNNLGNLYTVNPDPQRPACIWVNSDYGSSQIQNFDAFTPSQGCGQGPIRVLASTIVAPQQQCVPYSYSSLQVTQPPPSAYQSGTVSFRDSDNNPIPGAPDEALDSTGTASLSSLNNLNSNGLPQFLITLNGTSGTPSQVVVKLTWTGTYDPACVKSGTSVTAPGASPSQGPPPVGPPVVTGPGGGPIQVSLIPHHGATFSGLVFPDGLPTTVYYQYGLDRRYFGAAADRPTRDAHLLAGASDPVYDQQTQTQQVAGDFGSHPATLSATGLVPNALYHVRLVATNSAGTTYGPDVTFMTKKDPPPGPPVLGKSFDIKPVAGLVFIHMPGARAADSRLSPRLGLTKGQGFIPLTEARQLPTGTQIDARLGTIQLVSAASQPHKIQTGTFTGGLYGLAQDRSGLSKGLTTLSLLEGLFTGAPSYSSCTRAAGDSAYAAALSTKVLQTLRASAHGRFRTRGRYAAATVRGTAWTISDRCNGTLVSVQRHTVAVSDFVRHITVLVHAGHHYLARAKR